MAEIIDQKNSINGLLRMLTSKESDKKQMFDGVIKQICNVLDTDYCLAFELNEQKDGLTILGGKGSQNPPQTIGLNENWDVTYALKNKKHVIVDDYQKEVRFSKIPLLSQEIKSGASVIIRGTKTHFGILGVFSAESGSFNESKINFLQVIAILLGISLEKEEEKKKYEKISRSLKDKIRHMKDLQREIIKTHVHEKWRLGKYLQEELAQDLLATDLIIRSMVRNENGASVEIDDLERVMNRIVEDAKEIHDKIAPVDLEDQGITYAFKNLADYLEKTFETKCKIKGAEQLEQINDLEVATQLYRIVQETIKNAILYRQAKQILIVCKSDEKRLRVHVIDNGKMKSSAILKSNAMGLDLIEHQMKLLGGTLNIKLNTQGGTGLKVVLELPLKKTHHS